ncbi:cytochrome P450 [Boletus edulis BED1]|uniref:Cytochrome P450 n=1 Tax=Boletus edulis BED1 TaxID=1328754 RepID=A0AAD4BPK3_BOLED|nr:cytochrome P450 [Boletus edulis BED1]
MHDLAPMGTFALGCLGVLYIWRRALRTRNPYPLPPGPPGLPWVGNVIGINQDAPWLTYAGWARTYGDLVCSRLLGQVIIIINSEKIAKDLLEIRSRNFSDRPYFITTELYGVDFNSVLLPYGDRWRLHRRFFHQTFRLESVHRFLPYQHSRACLLLHQLLEMPEKLSNHIFERVLKYTASVILNSTYNYDPTSRKDDLIDTGKLLYLPSWFPGMSFKRDMVMARAYSKQYLERPFEHALQKVSGSVAPSMVHDALRCMEEESRSPEESWMQALKEAAGSAFLGTLFRSNSFLMTFFLMMVVNPVAQEKAQAQIDAVVGRDRLPGMEDRPLLPFIDAIFRETIRYSPIGPLSIPHAAGSMAHDESRYPNPHVFMPERFLNDDGSLKPDDTQHLAFGFGRRMCVGRHFADTSVWAVMAKVLAVFKILRPLDENGVEMPVEPRFSNGIAIHPLPFRCRIVPRFEGTDAERLQELILGSSA